MGAGVLLGGAALRARGVPAVGLVVVAVNLGPIFPLYWGVGATEMESELRIASYDLLQSATEDRGEVIEWLNPVSRRPTATIGICIAVVAFVDVDEPGIAHGHRANLARKWSLMP